MSTAKLNVWIARKEFPCEIDDSPQVSKDPKKPIQLFVYVLHCNGEVLVWCGKKYVGMQAKCGHLSVEVPPGCYIVGAVENPNGLPPLGNHLTHVAIVQAKCGDEICVTLFNPTMHWCRHWLESAIKGHLTTGGTALTNETTAAMRNAAEALTALGRVLPPDRFTETQAKALGVRT